MRQARKIKVSIAAFLCVFTLYFFLVPFGINTLRIIDVFQSGGEIPSFTYRWHQQLTADFTQWAKDRVSEGRALRVSDYDVAGTEWPMFSAVYYLWSTEALQKNWENKKLSSKEPVRYSQLAARAAIELILDPNNASWVKKHWGPDYMERENLFYRMLYVAGLTSYQVITGDTQYSLILTEQAEKLADEIDQSAYGLLDDYPGQCYPVDVLPAIAVIQRAAELQGFEHKDFVARAVRGFSNTRLDQNTQLPAYIANPNTGAGLGSARGVGIAYMLIWAPELWPKVAEDWYVKFENSFWVDGQFIAGFREFPKGRDLGPVSFDVDAGPIIYNYGAAASAYGIGAARVNGRLDQSYKLASQALVSSWPLPNGTMLLPRLLSNRSEAPLLGETALLFNFTRTQWVESALEQPSTLPGLVYFLLVVYVLLGIAPFYFLLRLLSVKKMPS